MKLGKFGLLSAGLLFSLSACDLLNPAASGPTINSFTATPSTVTAGVSSTLAWSVESTATSISISGGTTPIGNVTSDTDDRFDVSPTVTTVYTLTATNAEGTNTRTTTVTVSGTGGGGTDTGGPGGGGGGAGGPTGDFGLSTSPSGDFSSDEGSVIADNADPRIISVAAGSTFYAEVAYADPDGISGINLLLVNDEPAGLTLENSGFTIGEPTGDCDLSASPTAVTCVYPITVAPGTLDIEDLPNPGNEFAYVFRVSVTDSGGTPSGQSSRGYVNID